MMDMKKFTDQLETQTKQWQQQMADLQNQFLNQSGDLKQQYEKQIATMNEYVAKSQEMLGKIQATNEAAWKDMADGATQSFEDWQNAVQSAMGRYKS